MNEEIFLECVKFGVLHMGGGNTSRLSMITDTIAYAYRIKNYISSNPEEDAYAYINWQFGIAGKPPFVQLAEDDRAS